MSDDYADLARLVAELARQLTARPRNRDVGTRRRVGTVTATALDGTVTVDLGGTAVPGIPRLSSYTPTVGDTVVVLVDNGAPICIGKSAAA